MLKRGKFSLEEINTLVCESSRKSAEEVGRMINRSPEAVKNYWRNKGLIVEKDKDDKQEDNRLLAVLHSLPNWIAVISAFNEKEIEFYEKNWIAFMRQLHEDVSYSEQIFVQNWLTLEIEKKRVLEREKNAMASIEELKERISKAYYELNTTADPHRMAMLPQTIANMTTELASKEAVLAQSISSLIQLNKDIKTFSSSLKADREKRREKESSAETYWDYVGRIEDEKTRVKEGQLAEIYRLSLEKGKQDLYQEIQYEDGEWDRPILNSESVLLED